MKRLLLASLFLSIFLLAGAHGVHAQNAAAQYVPLAGSGIPGLTDQATAQQAIGGNFANFFNDLYKFCIGIAVVLAIIEIVWGGIEIATQDSVSKKQDGRSRIAQAIFGLILVLSPVLVFSIINGNILNFTVAFKPLNLSTGGSVSLPAPTGQNLGPGQTPGSSFSPYITCSSSGDCSNAQAACNQQKMQSSIFQNPVVCVDTSGFQVAVATKSITGTYSCSQPTMMPNVDCH